MGGHAPDTGRASFAPADRPVAPAVNHETATLVPPPRGLLGRILRLEQALIEGLVVLMAALICAEVVCRSLLGFSLMVTEELAGYLLVALVFLGMPVALANGALFRVELVLSRLRGRARSALELAFDLVALGVALVLLRELGRFVADSWQRGVRAPTVLATPLYLPQAVMVLGLLTLVLVLVLHVLRDLRALRDGEIDHE